MSGGHGWVCQEVEPGWEWYCYMAGIPCEGGDSQICGAVQLPSRFMIPLFDRVWIELIGEPRIVEELVLVCGELWNMESLQNFVEGLKMGGVGRGCTQSWPCWMMWKTLGRSQISASRMSIFSMALHLWPRTNGSGHREGLSVCTVETLSPMGMEPTQGSWESSLQIRLSTLLTHSRIVHWNCEQLHSRAILHVAIWVGMRELLTSRSVLQHQFSSQSIPPSVSLKNVWKFGNWGYKDISQWQSFRTVGRSRNRTSCSCVVEPQACRNKEVARYVKVLHFLGLVLA